MQPTEEQRGRDRHQALWYKNATMSPSFAPHRSYSRGWLDRHVFMAGGLALLGWLLIAAIWLSFLWPVLQGPPGY